MTDPLDLDAMLKHGGGASYTDVLVLVKAVRERDAEIERWRADYADTARCLNNERKRFAELPGERDAEIAHLRGIVGDCNRENLLRTMELDEARAEIERLRAPPGADVMEIARNCYWGVPRKDGSVIHPNDERHPIFCVGAMARALQQYGDERAAAATSEAEVGPARTERDGILYREGREAAIEEAARAAKGHDAERPAYHEAAAAYIQGRLDARNDVRALAEKPGSRK